MATLHGIIINNSSLHIWAQTTSIIGSIFLALAIYSYFYRKLDKREKNIDKVIIKADYFLQRISIMAEKSEVQAMLDAVAAFNTSINGFKDNIINTVRSDIKELESRLITHFDREISRTNEDVKEIKVEVDILRDNAGKEKTELSVQKNKLGWTLTIGMIVFGIINSAVVFFVIKGLS